MRISDWSSDVCSSDLRCRTLTAGDRSVTAGKRVGLGRRGRRRSVTILLADVARHRRRRCHCPGHQDRLEQARTLALALRLRQFRCNNDTTLDRSEEHTSELQSLMRISYAVFCLKKKITNT